MISLPGHQAIRAAKFAQPTLGGHVRPAIQLGTTGSRRSRQPLLTKAAAATGQATREQVDDAVSVLAQGLKGFEDLVPEHAVRANPEFQEPFAILKANHEQSNLDVKSHSINGFFDCGLNTNNYYTDEGIIPLGTLTFQQIKPKDLKVHLQPGYWLEQGVRSKQSYNVYTIFKIFEGPHEGVEGITNPDGVYEFDEKRPYRQHVIFNKFKVHPKDSSKEGLAKWKAALQEANPNMAEDGTIDIEFPQPVKGWRDFAHIDDQLHISVGNRNSVVIVRRCEPPSFIA